MSDNPYASPRSGGPGRPDGPREVDMELAIAENGKRFLAYLIDMILVTFGSAFVLGFLVAFMGSAGTIDQDAADSLGAMVQVAAFLITVLYGALMESSARQATLGKMAMGLVVTDAHGQRLPFMTALGRNIVKSLALSCCSLIAITIFNDVYRRGVWDQAVKTRVIPKWAIEG